MIELLASDVYDSYATNIVLDDAVRDNTTDPVEASVFWRYKDEPTAEPKFLGTATIGVPFSAPFNFDEGREIELFAVAKTASGVQAAINSLNGETQEFLPNLETLTPVIALTPGITVTNVLAKVTVTEFTNKSLHRKIAVSVNSDMSDATFTYQAAADFNGQLPNEIDIPKGATSGVEHRYVTVQHSSNDEIFGTASNILDITFADSGGSGGGGGDVRAIITSAAWTVPSDVDIDWSAASGSGNYTIQYRRREQSYDSVRDQWRYSSWTYYGWTTATSTEAASPYTDSQGYAADYGAEVQVQYRIKRTSQDDSLYSDIATVEIPAEP